MRTAPILNDWSVAHVDAIGLTTILTKLTACLELFGSAIKLS
ncbi:hypothetical protein PAMC26577_36975 [Caballeronia sordidicola]|uniref:Uncharacterized protein n=1 Tax=Caballeronia sordidicola TaxID=196367 RepID=A0A242M839_CABSO|nr:hypothetical protein PAMC26577_36975 [Caballeronia sordidicola]